MSKPYIIHYNYTLQVQCISIVLFVAVYFNSLCFAILYKYALSFSRVLFVQTRTKTKTKTKKTKTIKRQLGRGMKLVVQDMDLKNPVLVRGLGLG